MCIMLAVRVSLAYWCRNRFIECGDLEKVTIEYSTWIMLSSINTTRFGMVRLLFNLVMLISTAIRGKAQASIHGTISTIALCS